MGARPECLSKSAMCWANQGSHDAPHPVDVVLRCLCEYAFVCIKNCMDIMHGGFLCSRLCFMLALTDASIVHINLFMFAACKR